MVRGPAAVAAAGLEAPPGGRHVSEQLVESHTGVGPGLTGEQVEQLPETPRAG
ncbi:hypothetical protein GCM10027519_37700 [Kineococcus endophyticus]